MAESKTYVVRKDGFIHGDWRNHNAHIELTEAQARPFLREGRIALKEEPRAAPAPEAKAEAKR